MTTGKLLATAGILLALASLSFLPAAAQSYTVTDLGTLGGTISNALALNDNGQVVGFSNTTNGNGQHAFLWSAETGMQDLGLLHPGDGNSYANRINQSGQVVGSSGSYAFSWTKTGGMQDLGSLGGVGGIAYAINRTDQVVGTSLLSDNLTQHAFLWSSTSGMTDIGSLGGSSFAYAINDNRQVVGTSFLADNSTVHAFLWTQASGMQDLGTLGGVDSYAYGINAGGVVVGMSNTASGYVGFLWTRNTGMLPLNLASTTAWGINSSKQVVGTWVPSKQSGFLWTQTKGVQNLNGLVTPKNIRVGSALAINRSGQIAAFSGQHALLLTPTK